MAEMTIQLKTNPETGKKDIIVSLTSDDDSLPHEHEEMHRCLLYTSPSPRDRQKSRMPSSA